MTRSPASRRLRPVPVHEPDGAPSPRARGPRRFVDDYLAFLLAQASHSVSAQFHSEVQTAGLSVTEWRVLASLAGGARETIGDLSELTLTKQPTLSKVVQRMERQGLVARIDAPTDRRQTLVTLTPAGQAQAQAHILQALAHQERVLKPLGTRHARVLIAVLRRLLQRP